MRPSDSDPILSCAEAGDWEKKLFRGDPAREWDAMQRAGTAIAQAIEQDFREIGGLPEDARVLVLAGKGHNGGDALLAARGILAGRKRARATVVLVFGRTALRPLVRKALEALRRTGGARVAIVGPDEADWSKQAFDISLDGIFGFQFRPPVDAATARVFARINAHPRVALRAAVDLPSGVGDKPGASVVRADFTYATGIVKAPVLAQRNAAEVGRLRYLDLGFFAADRRIPVSTRRITVPAILRPLAKIRPAHVDKRTYGHLVLVGGSRDYPGAILMAAEAALRSGVGLLTACVPAPLVPEYAARLPEVMWSGTKENSAGGLAAGSLALLRRKLHHASALAIGPGMGAAPATTRAIRDLIRKAPCPVVMDADALRPKVVAATQPGKWIGTPHAGEFKRIAGESDLTAFCRKTGGVVVLKGSPTRVGDGKSEYFSLHGGPVLARGGSGDLLAGLIGGLLAQTPTDPLLAARRGVMWHGLAADLLARAHGQVAVQTTQLLDYLEPALRVADSACRPQSSGEEQ